MTRQNRNLTWPLRKAQGVEGVTRPTRHSRGREPVTTILGTRRRASPCLPRVTPVHRAVGYHSGCRQRLRRATPPQARARSSRERVRGCHEPPWRAPALTRCWRWEAMTPCWMPCPRERESVGRELLSARCEESRLIIGKLADVLSHVALRWKVPHWVATGVLVELGSDPTLAEIRETKLPNGWQVSPSHSTTRLAGRMRPGLPGADVHPAVALPLPPHFWKSRHNT